MPISINLPPDFRVAADALREHPADPAAQEFLRLVRAEVLWSLAVPRMLLRTARRVGVRVHSVAFLEVTMTGFRARRPQHLGSALATIAKARRIRGQYIYDDGRDLLIIGDSDAPQRCGAPDGFGHPQQLGSIFDLAKPPAMSSEPPAPSAPAADRGPAPVTQPPRPAAPSFLTR